jgi:hypothetical protein
MTRAKDTDSLMSCSSEDWHPFQRFDKNGVPKRFDILDTFSKFLSVFDESKAFTKAPNLITEEVNVAFTIYINWLNHARLVNFTHVFWYIEFLTNNSNISTLTRFSWRFGAFMWTTPLSREWAGLFLRHGLLEASPTNTSDSFYLSKVYFKLTHITFKRIFFLMCFLIVFKFKPNWLFQEQVPKNHSVSFPSILKENPVPRTGRLILKCGPSRT